MTSLVTDKTLSPKHDLLALTGNVQHAEHILVVVIVLSSNSFFFPLRALLFHLLPDREGCTSVHYLSLLVLQRAGGKLDSVPAVIR